MQTSWELPGVIWCRVVGVSHSNPFMPDYYERRLATKRFFSDDITAADKLDILSYYSVSYVLVPKAHETTIADFMAHLKPVYNDCEYALYTIKK